MINKKKTMTVLGLLPLAAFGTHVGGSVNIESGYRTDVLKATGTVAGNSISEKMSHINGVSVGLNGRLTINDFYIRGAGDYFWVVGNPNYSVTTNGTTTTGSLLTSEYGYDASAALGYSFYFNNGEFSLAPEAGYAYQSLNVYTNVTESLGSPFVGFDFNWNFSTDWKFGFLLDFYLYGYRSSDLLPASLGTNKTAPIKKGYYMGPDAKVSFDYFFTENWSLGVAYRFRYFFTNKQDVAGFTNETQKWMINSGTLNVGYTF